MEYVIVIAVAVFALFWWGRYTSEKYARMYPPIQVESAPRELRPHSHYNPVNVSVGPGHSHNVCYSSFSYER